MDKSIRVHILERDYGLRVSEATEAATRQVAALVDEWMRDFRAAHPDQPELTVAVVTALALAEELRALRQRHADEASDLDAELERLSARIDEALRMERPA